MPFNANGSWRRACGCRRQNQATLRAADYLLSAKVLYFDSDSGGGGGGLGSMLPGGLGLRQKVKPSQTMLTLIEVKTGIQQPVATGSARKKDLSIIDGGILTSAGVGALGGAYTSTDMGEDHFACPARRLQQADHGCSQPHSRASGSPRPAWSDDGQLGHAPIATMSPATPPRP